MHASSKGWLAQLVEHRPYKARVTGSTPVPPTIQVLEAKKFGPVVQLVRMPACHAGGRGFESRPVRQSASSTCIDIPLLQHQSAICPI